MNAKTVPHSEVPETLQYIDNGKALDLGCGRGRNSIFLAENGFDVTALDISEPAIKSLQSANISNIDAQIYNAEIAAIQNQYDLIISTVVFQFLNAKSIAPIIANIQDKTNTDGINLIVAPIHSAQHPCSLDFPFTFKPNELKEFYEGWSILKYNENEGEFHRTDENGNRYKAHFATLIARKN